MRKTTLTLIELLIVISLLVIVAGSVAVEFGDTSRNAEQTVVTAEIRKICDSFMRFCNDCQPTEAQLHEIRKFGLWPLTTAEHRENWGLDPAMKDTDKDYAMYDPANVSGWSGPYICVEGHRSIDPDTDGQPEITPGGTSIPVVLDPTEKHYRVMAPKKSGVYYPEKLLLIRLAPGRTETEIQTAIDPLVDDWTVLETIRTTFSDCAFEWLMPDQAQR